MQIALLFILLFASILPAQDFSCKVDDRIMYAIAKIERHRSTPVGYPYLISINMKQDQITAKKDASLRKYFLDNRTIDCNSKKECVAILKKLQSQKITNLDCGAFQINRQYWSLKDEDYFDVKKSYFKACEIVMSHNKTKWTWENIAKYHSKTRKYNDKYKKYLIATIERSMKSDGQ